MLETVQMDNIMAAGRLLQDTGEPSFSVGPVVGILSVLVLVFLNGFFVATEFAMVTVRRSRIDQLAAEGSGAATTVAKTLDRLDKLIAATQLGITMASLGLGWVGEPAVADLLTPLFDGLPLPTEWHGTVIHTVAFIVSFSLITAFHILVGELVPKAIAIQRAETTALFVARPVAIFMTVFGPAVRALSSVGNLVLRLIGLHPVSGEESIHSVDELRYLVKASGKAGILEQAEADIASRAFALGDLTARRVMVPRTELVTVPATATLHELYELAANQHHVRFPVYEGDVDHVIGVLHLTDVVGWELLHPDEPFDLRKKVRTALMVPESLEGDRLLAQMRKARTHSAIVVDEFGGVEGMVTLQDLLERIVGDLPEMDENDRPDIEVLPDGTTLIDGLAPVAELSARFDIALEDHEAETVGGYVMETLGRVPQLGEELLMGDYRLRVAEMDGPRIARVVLSK